MTPVLQLIVFFVCMAGEAFFAGIETGVISIHRLRLRHFVKANAPGAQILQAFLDQSDRLLGTTLVGTNICVVVMSVTATSLLVSWIGKWGESAATVLVSVLALVFCEYLPKAWFHQRPLDRSRRFAGILRLAEMAFRPLSFSIIWISRRLVPGPSAAFSKPVPFVTKEDLKILAREGEKDGVLSPRERFMIHRVFELGAKRARDIMTPRDRMQVLETTMSLEQFYDTARATGFTRFPVIDPAGNRFAGVVNVFYALSVSESETVRSVGDLMRPPLFVDEDLPVDDILPRLRRFRQPLCLVRRANSGEVIGLITTEDILKEIVGRL